MDTSDRDNAGTPSQISTSDDVENEEQMISSNRIFRYGWTLLALGIGCFVTKSLYVTLTPDPLNLTIIFLAAGSVLFGGLFLIVIFWKNSCALVWTRNASYYYAVLTLASVLPLVSCVICIINAVAGYESITVATNIVLALLFMASSAVLSICIYEVSQRKRHVESNRQQRSHIQPYLIPVAWSNPPPYQSPPSYHSNPASEVNLRSSISTPRGDTVYSSQNDNNQHRHDTSVQNNNSVLKTYLVIKEPPTYEVSTGQ